MKTIRKNSKEFMQVLTSKGWNVYSLGNSFSGEPVDSSYDLFAQYKDRKNAKLTYRNGFYSLYVHSNLWYEKKEETANFKAYLHYNGL
jgi:hypothetical protein